MNRERRPADFESLEPPLEAAVKAALAGPIPEDAIERVKVRAKQLPGTAVSECRDSNSHKRGRRASRRIIGGLTVAAALLLIVTGGFVLLDYFGGRAFAQVIEKVKAARSVRFTTLTRFGKQREISGLMYLEDNRVRFEQSDRMLIQVVDLDRKQALILDTHRKLAQTGEIDANVVRDFTKSANPIDQLRRVKSDDAEQIGEEILEGRRTQVYRLPKVDLLDIKRSDRGETLVWVDVESGLPAKIVIRDSDPKSPMEFRFEDFVWNEPLDARLFSLAVPDGFQTGVVMTLPSPRKPTQANVTAADNPDYLADGILSRDRVPARIVWDPQGKTITALMRDLESVPPQERREHELRQWDVATGKRRWSVTAGTRRLAGTADGKTLATVVNFELQLRDAASGQVTRKWATDEYVSPLAFSPDGMTLAAAVAEWGRHGGKGGEESGGVQFWNIERASLVRTVSDDKPTTFIRYSLDGKHLATSPNGGPVKLWNVSTGELTRIFPGRSPADLSPDGDTIACASIPPREDRTEDKTIGKLDLYNLRDGSLVKSFASEKGASASWLLCVTFSPDGRLLAASDWNGTVALWDVATGQRKQTFTDHQGGVLWIAFAPDGATLATGSEDETLRLRKLSTDLIQPAPERR